MSNAFGLPLLYSYDKELMDGFVASHSTEDKARLTNAR